MICPQCGKEASGHFCSECGARLPQDPPAVQPAVPVGAAPNQGGDPDESGLVTGQQHLRDLRQAPGVAAILAVENPHQIETAAGPVRSRCRVTGECR